MKNADTAGKDISSEDAFIRDLKRVIANNEKLARKLAQIMFIGPPGSGKTTLMYRLLNRNEWVVASSTGVSDSVIMVDCKIYQPFIQ